MRRWVSLLVTVSLIFSLAAPTGAVFASNEPGLDTPDDGSVGDTEYVAEETVDKADLGENDVTEEVLVDEPVVEDPDLQTQTEQLELIGSPEPEEDNDLTGPVIEELPSSLASSLVITEVQTRGILGANSELVELFNAGSLAIDLTGWCLKYSSASGDNYSNLRCIEASDKSLSTRVILPEKSYLVLSTADRKTTDFIPDLVFTPGLVDSGGRLKIEDENHQQVDLVGWGSAKEFLGSKSAPPLVSTLPLKSLQRKIVENQYQNNLDNFDDFSLIPAKTSYVTGSMSEMVDMCGNLPGIQTEVPSNMRRLKNGECIDILLINSCDQLKISELGANVIRQFIELTNTSSQEVSLKGCQIMTNRSSTNRFILPDQSVQAGKSYVVFIADTKLKLTKTTVGTVYLFSSDGENMTDQLSYEDLSSESSWARFTDGWKQTFLLTPGENNLYEPYPACQEGYARNIVSGRCTRQAIATTLVDCGEGRERNPLTGRCRNLPTTTQLSPCKDGQYRSEETNRCRSIASVANSILKPCADDQFRNPETNRCKKIASAEELTDCGEGRERNPVTNRCRNISLANMPSAGFAPEKINITTGSTLGWWIFGGFSLMAMSYAIWQWRFEINRSFRKIKSIFSSLGKQ